MITGETVEYVNGINLNILKETVQGVQQDPGLGGGKFRARNKWVGGAHNCSTIASFYAARQEMEHKQPFELHADEPPLLAGEDQGANPVEYLLTALAGCVTTSMVAHAAMRGIRIEELESELEGDIDMRGFFGLDPTVPKGFTHIRVRFKAKTDPKNLERLRELAEFSPVYNTLTHGVPIDLEIVPM